MIRPRLLLFAHLVWTASGVAGCAQTAPAAPSTGPLRFSGSISALERAQVGAPIPGAALTVISGVNAAAAVTTDGTGHFSFENLQSGRFTLRITAPGYIGVTPVVELYRDTEANFVLVAE
jgi:hypothetical protein